MNENQLIKSCIQADRKAQQRLYDTYSGQMYSICLRYCKDEVSAADALQVGFIKVFKNLSKYNYTGQLGAWIRRIIVNACLDQINLDKRHFATELNIDTDSEQEYHMDLMFDDFNYKRLLSLLNKLPEGYRVVFSMSVLDELTHSEIAESLNISVSTSRSQLLKARKQMQQLIVSDKYLSLKNNNI